MLPRLFVCSLILFCLELGVFLVVLPWTGFWEHNYFLFRYPALGPYLLNYYLRGLISGLGLIDLGLGLWYTLQFRRLVASWGGALKPPGSDQDSSRESLTRDQTV